METAVAIATEAFEVHLADDGSSALAVYPLEAATGAERKRLVSILEGMGFPFIGESGWREVGPSECGLTGDLDWDLLLAESCVSMPPNVRTS